MDEAVAHKFKQLFLPNVKMSLVACPRTNTANFIQCIFVACVENLHIDFT